MQRRWQRNSGAEENLQRIKEKFTHENETYKIIVPERLIDIVTEGRAPASLRAGATERYFERIRDNETYICFLRKKSEPDVPFYTIRSRAGGLSASIVPCTTRSQGLKKSGVS